MHSSVLLLLFAASLGLATDCDAAAQSCVNSVSVNAKSCPLDSTMIPDPCSCSIAAQVVQCWSSACLGQAQASYAQSAYDQLCSGSTVYAPGGFPTAVSGISSSTAAATTSTDTFATATAAATAIGTGTGTGTGVTGGVTTAPASGSASGDGAGSRSGSSVTAGGSAAPGSTSKAWGERSLALPAGGIMAAVLGLAILL